MATQRLSTSAHLFIGEYPRINDNRYYVLRKLSEPGGTTVALAVEMEDQLGLLLRECKFRLGLALKKRP